MLPIQSPTTSEPSFPPSRNRNDLIGPVRTPSRVLGQLENRLFPEYRHTTAFRCSPCFRAGPLALRSLHGCIDLALLGQPGHASPFGVFLDLTKELNRFRLVARLAGVIDRDDHLDLDRNHILLGLNQAGPLDSLSGDTHG